ncbi:MAG: Calx-beta domain-containing protein, partial [Mycolicibacterium sp.]
MSYGSFVGRVGALAVALGIGIALPVEALADSTEGSSAEAKASSPSGNSSEHAAASEPTTAGVASTQEAPAQAGGDEDEESAAGEEDEADAQLEPGLEDLDGAVADEDAAPDAESAPAADDDAAAPEVLPADGDRGRDTTAVDPESSSPIVAEVSDDAEQDEAEEIEASGAATSPDLTAESVSRKSVGGAAVVTVPNVSQTPVTAPAAPQTVASTKRTGLLSSLLSLLTPRQSGQGTDAPLAPAETFAAALQLIRRDLEKLFSNRGPSAAPTLTSQSDPAVVTGSVNAVDPENDRLVYRVVQGPSGGTLVIDRDGNFTYTARADLATQGGTDTFVVAVRDISLSLNFWVPKRIEVPITVTLAGSPQAIALAGGESDDSGLRTAAPMAMAMAMSDDGSHDHHHSGESEEFVTLASFGDLHGSDHTGHEGLVGGRTAITTEALLAYNNLRQFAGLAPVTIDEVGAWAFANGLTNNTQAWGNDQKGVGLYYAMQGAKVGWIADDKYDPQILADIQRTARLGAAEDVMSMVHQYGHDGFAEFLTANDFDETFINTLKMEPHNAGWMHSRAHGRLSIEGVATSHDVNHLTVLSHDQTKPFMNDTFDWPQWPALEVSDSGVIEYFQSMVVLGDPLGSSLEDLTSTPSQGGSNPASGANSGNPGDALWGEEHFAPYVDMAGWPPPDLIKIAKDYGVSLLNLGFVQATSDGKAAWGGYSTLTPGSSDSQAQTIDASIAAFKAAGGDVMVSFGGANGTELAQWYSQRGLSAQALANAYAAVVDAYGLNRVDFDIEGHAVAEPTSIALRSQAIKLLQQARPDLEVWYTLPVLPTGLTHDGRNVVSKALDAGVKLDGVNVMAMDYGESAAPTSGPNAKTMGAYAILAAESTYAQMSTLFAQHGQQFGWNQLGVTPMIGVNDVITEIFTVADAQALEHFAHTKGLGMLSMWSVARDTPGSLGQASPTASGLNIPAGSFSNVWNDYGTINEMNLGSTPGNGGGGGGGGPVTGGTTTVIGWNWGANTVLNFDPAKDKLDFGWMQPGHFDVTEQSGSTKITIVNNGGQAYTLNGVALNQMKIGNIVALDTNTVAKWQTLIANAGPAVPQLPSISIGDMSVVEGNGAHSHFMFVATLSKASTTPVTVNYATSNGTAVAGSDFVASAGTLTFAPGVTSQMVHVDIIGDSVVEGNETFTVTLSSPSGATISKATATGTITNDDVAPVLPAISIADVSKAEGNSGSSNI